MRELKEVYAYQSDEIESLFGNANGNSYYLKSEADKVIAHHKYKRCLAMAKWCDDAARLATWDTDYRRCGWYNKWRKRWLAIAEKFKPNSTLQQKD